MPRETLVHWGWLVYLEMFVAGIAAGAYLTAAILELVGRGRSPIARTAHLLAFPLLALAGLLLIVDLDRPERFWHMLLQSERPPLPILKWWSPMSVGSWGLLVFSGFAFISFVDALLPERRLHGTALGRVWSLVGTVPAFFVGAYSGVLLSVTNIPGWMDSPLIGGLFLAISAATGMAALLLIEGMRGVANRGELIGLETASTLTLLWMLVMLAAFLFGAGSFFASGGTLVAIVAAVLVGAVVPLLARLLTRPPASAEVGVTAALVLLGGLLLRYAIVMGPQTHG